MLDDKGQGRPVAVIVSHGQPSEPAPAEADLALLAAAVADLLPDWDVRSATLADEGALARAAAGSEPVIYPLFMSEGWFTRNVIPKRLAAAGITPAVILDAFGTDPSVTDLCRMALRNAALNAGYEPEQTEVILAVHGSSKSRASAEIAEAVVAELTVTAGLGEIRAAFIEEDPRILEVAKATGPKALCLPFFAARLGHVIGDIPEALAEADFQGQLLDPIGLHPDVPGLIVHSLRAARVTL